MIADVAVIGMAGRFPGAADPETLWSRVKDGEELLSRIPLQTSQEHGVADAVLSDPGYVPVRGVLDGIEDFPLGQFSLPEREAELTDPAHRLLLELSVEALEHAGYTRKSVERRVGVFVGTGYNSYRAVNLVGHDDLLEDAGPLATAIASEKDHAATRIAYQLGLTGPAVAVQTACSTSLSAVHMAVRSLLDGECDMALAGGACVGVPQQAGYVHTAHDVTSADGRCRPFDRDANGTMPGSGAGIVVLRRAVDSSGDQVHAVIAGSAMNNDGQRRSGYTAPSIEGQVDVIRRALERARFDASEIGFVQAHGTATELGDWLELEALAAVFADHPGQCAVHSVKANVGHLDAAAGVTGLITAVLAVRDGVIPLALHYRSPNAHSVLGQGPLYVPTMTMPWKDTVRVAGVSSFGIGGTNVHVVVRSGTPAAEGPGAPADGSELVTVSADAPQHFRAVVRDLRERLPRLPLGSVGLTTRSGRSDGAWRQAFVANDTDDLTRAMSEGALSPNSGRGGPVVLSFPGQGTQRQAMAQELRRRFATVDRLLRSCADAAPRECPDEVRRALLGEPVDVDRTDITQPLLFAVEVAIARLLQSFDVEPDVVLGHSLGEISAAHIAGALPLEEAMTLVCARGALVQTTCEGGLLAVPLPEQHETVLASGLDVVAVNGRMATVLGGPLSAVETAGRSFDAAGTRVRRLPGSRAFHTRLLDPILEDFATILDRISFKELVLPLASGLTGTLLPPGTILDAGYWLAQLRSPVRFRDAAAAVGTPGAIVIESGPGLVTSSLVAAAREDVLDVVQTMPGRQDPALQPEDRLFATAIGRLWELGIEVDLLAWPDSPGARRLGLPPAPLQRRRCWVEPRDARGATSPGPPPAPTAQPGPELDAVATAEAGTRDQADVPAAVADAWRSLLGKDVTDGGHDFFAVGGSSMLLVRFIALIRRRFGVSIELSALLEDPTLEGMTRTVAGRVDASRTVGPQ